MQLIIRRLVLLALVAAWSGQLDRVMASGAGQAGKTPNSAVQPAPPDPAVMTYRLPQDLKFDPNKTEGSDQIVLYGDPTKPGSPYQVLIKWYPHSMSQPHFHENDRYIYVVSGTWWVGSGTKYDPNSTYPMPAGSFVHHLARRIHYDGAKDEACVIIISGIGPAQPFPPAKMQLKDSELDKELQAPKQGAAPK